MLAYTNFPLKGPETTRENRHQRFKYFPQNFSLDIYAVFMKKEPQITIDLRES